MVVYCVTIHVKSGHEEDFRMATKSNRDQTRQEMANQRFDVLQSEEDPTRFMLYEVYRSEDAVKAHKETTHYKKWRDTVAPWMAEARQGIRYTAIYPHGEEGWS